MSEDKLAIAINSRTRDLIMELRLWEPKGFGPQFSRTLLEELRSGVALADAIDHSLTEEFKVANVDGLDAFLPHLSDRLAAVLADENTLLDVLKRFKEYAERQLVHGFKKMNNEEFCRSNLQTYLEQAGRSTREVKSGGGWIDVVVATGEPVEAKLWKGPEYHAEGIEELQEYMRTEGQTKGYYVVFDTLASNSKLEDWAEIGSEGGLIVQVAVRMNPGQPSNKRRIRRSTESSQNR